MAMMPDLAGTKTLRGSELLEAISASLLYEAARIRSIEIAIRPAGWDEQRASAHNALCAAVAIIDWIAGVGAKAVAKKERPPNFVMTAADAARESLIVELTTQAIVASSEIKEGADAVSA
jgi:hypothetical protein